MNHTPFINRRALRRWSVPVLIACVTALAVWTAGCSDQRSEPLNPAQPEHTETVPLWQNAQSNGQIVPASFTIHGPLAPILNPSTDRPARLNVVTYLRPDDEVIWREKIISDSIPPLGDLIIQYLIVLSHEERALKALYSLDSACADTIPADSCAAAIAQRCADDTLLCDTLGLVPSNLDSLIAAIGADTTYYHSLIAGVVADTTALGLRRDQLAAVLETRYTLALWLDDTTAAPVYPSAIYTSTGEVGGQGLYLPPTDTSSTSPSRGYKGRGFSIPLNSFEAADPNNPTYTYEVNWVTCFAGSNRPCLDPNVPHTLYARVTGPDTRVSGSLVLVYEGTNP